MRDLPTFIDSDDAIEYYTDQTCEEAEKAYITAYLSKEGFTNRDIRAALDIEKVYTVTHLKRAGSLSEEALVLWLNNPGKLSLSHMRVISRLPEPQHLEALRKVIAHRWSVEQLIRFIQNDPDQDADVIRFTERMSEVLGRSINIQFDKRKQSGSLTLDFWSLDDLDGLAKQLGFEPSEWL